MRILFGVAAFWGAVAALIVTLLLARGGEDLPLPPAEAWPLSCEALEARARQCEKPLVTAAADFVEQASLRAGRSAFTAGGRRLVVAGFLQDAIARGEVARQCAGFEGSRVPRVLRLRRELERCWRSRGCDGFVSCLRRVAEAEEAAGNLPL